MRTKSDREPRTERRVPVCLRCDIPMLGHNCLYGICQGCIDREQKQNKELWDALKKNPAGIGGNITRDEVPF